MKLFNIVVVIVTFLLCLAGLFLLWPNISDNFPSSSMSSLDVGVRQADIAAFPVTPSFPGPFDHYLFYSTGSYDFGMVSYCTAFANHGQPSKYSTVVVFGPWTRQFDSSIKGLAMAITAAGLFLLLVIVVIVKSRRGGLHLLVNFQNTKNVFPNAELKKEK